MTTTEPSTEPQAQQHALVEYALADPRVAAAIRAYDAVRPYVPEPSVAALVTTYTTSSALTSSGTSA